MAVAFILQALAFSALHYAFALPAGTPMLPQEDLSNPLNGRSQAMNFENEEAELRFLEASLLDAKIPVFIRPVLAYMGKGATIAAAPEAIYSDVVVDAESQGV